MKPSPGKGGRKLDAIQYCHVKEFHTRYQKNGDHRVKWVEVTLQVIVDSSEEATALCRRLTEHMDTPLPRFMQMTEQPISEKARKP